MKAASLLAIALVSAIPAAAQQDTTIHELAAVEVMPRPTNLPAFQAALEAAYPAAMRGSAMDGEVTVRFVVGIDGVPAAATVMTSTHPAWEAASLAAVQVLRFEPARKAGQPVRVWVEVPVRWATAPAPATATPAASPAAVAPAAAPAASAPPAAAAAPSNPGTEGTYPLRAVDVMPRVLNAAEFGRTLERSYPPEARAAGLEATVTVRFRILPDGTVDPNSIAVISSTNPVFNAATMHAVQVLRFRPARVGREPVRVWVDQPIRWTVARAPIMPSERPDGRS